jgi:integrase
VRIFHHKTGEHVWLPLEHRGQRFYPELADWLSRPRRLGVPIVLLNAQRGGTRPYSESYADHLVQKARKVAGLPGHVTLAACRHGGMTELGDGQLTEKSIMALSGHRTPQAARVYVKRTERQRLAATAQRRRFLETEHDGNDCGNGALEKGERERDNND